VNKAWQINFYFLVIIYSLLFIFAIMEITEKTARQLRLTEEEFELIKQKLGRTPNFNELCAFSGMWSEHCSYKNSIKWLKTLKGRRKDAGKSR